MAWLVKTRKNVNYVCQLCRFIMVERNVSITFLKILIWMNNRKMIKRVKTCLIFVWLICHVSNFIGVDWTPKKFIQNQE